MASSSHTHGSLWERSERTPTPTLGHARQARVGLAEQLLPEHLLIQAPGPLRLQDCSSSLDSDEELHQVAPAVAGAAPTFCPPTSARK